MSRFSPFVFVKHGVCAGAYNRVFVHSAHIHAYIHIETDDIRLIFSLITQ